jgi:hypothetical protein
LKNFEFFFERSTRKKQKIHWMDWRSRVRYNRSMDIFLKHDPFFFVFPLQFRVVVGGRVAGYYASTRGLLFSVTKKIVCGFSFSSFCSLTWVFQLHWRQNINNWHRWLKNVWMKF